MEKRRNVKVITLYLQLDGIFWCDNDLKMACKHFDTTD